MVARETGGFVNRDTQGVIALDPGLYVGPLDTASLLAALSLTFTPTGQPGGSQDADGLTTGYFVENQFNALDAKIATNENDGLWRTFGVDGNGSRLETRLYGDDRNNPNFITTFTTFDARGRKLSDWRGGIRSRSGTTKRPVHSYTRRVRQDDLGHRRARQHASLRVQRARHQGEGDRSVRPLQATARHLGRETATVSGSATPRLFYDLRAGSSPSATRWPRTRHVRRVRPQLMT